ncbi:DUF945 family protein [Kordiimonas sp. SCSIO 12603]|uniref:DUF945 family protein n=1 Tax=Kordiimonas sp. SCSIO 12603 TaxID=2829596 RepID=UPI002103088A|nr:DUF945 family protein [Kordiimonas sp. SCSIO 12603]UTW57180.1 DUF945 family protein [Kordiimonas sp. SCSIO 12603]
MKNSKIIIGVLLAGTAFYIGGAKLISSSIEEGVRKTVNAYSQQVSIPLEVIEFNNGWFSSDFKIRFPLSPSILAPLQDIGLPFEADTNGTGITFSTNIQHGPVIFKDGIHFGAAYASGDIEVDFEKLIEKENDTSPTEKKAMTLLAESLKSTYTISSSFGGEVLFTSSLKGGSILLPAKLLIKMT